MKFWKWQRTLFPIQFFKKKKTIPVSKTYRNSVTSRFFAFFLRGEVYKWIEINASWQIFEVYYWERIETCWAIPIRNLVPFQTDECSLKHETFSVTMNHRITGCFLFYCYHHEWSFLNNFFKQKISEFNFFKIHLLFIGNWKAIQRTITNWNRKKMFLTRILLFQRLLKIIFPVSILIMISSFLTQKYAKSEGESNFFSKRKKSKKKCFFIYFFLAVFHKNFITS